ncbi:hypothetical protein N9H39_06015 [Gammaproteobacteria bacterium]|nr:hypothetical protein [Gammaproteobacteria bacterium]
MKTWMLISLMTAVFPITSAWGETLAAVVDWGQRFELGPLVGGTVTTANAKVGDRVEKGSELMQIDPTPYQHRVVVAEARVEATRVDYESSRQLHERQQELYDIGSLSTVALEESSYASIRMESAYRLAQAELELARYNLDKTSMWAPFDAWIIDKRVFVGQSLSTKQIIPVSYVVAPVGRYIATATASTNDTARPPVGSEVEVEINGAARAGTVSFPRESIRLEAGQFTIEFKDEDHLILPGTPARVIINR